MELCWKTRITTGDYWHYLNNQRARETCKDRPAGAPISFFTTPLPPSLVTNLTLVPPSSKPDCTTIIILHICRGVWMIFPTFTFSFVSSTSTLMVQRLFLQVYLVSSENNRGLFELNLTSLNSGLFK